MNIVDFQLVTYGNLLFITGLKPVVIAISIVSIISKVEKLLSKLLNRCLNKVTLFGWVTVTILLL